jgi:hypothetical protein
VTTDLRKAIRPHAEKLVDAFVDLLVADIEGTVDRAQMLALASFSAALTRKEADVAPPDERPAKRSTRAKKVESSKSEKKSGTRGPYKCKKCGAPGFRADGCGTTHNIPASKPAPVAPTNGVAKRDDILARAKARDAAGAR